MGAEVGVLNYRMQCTINGELVMRDVRERGRDIDGVIKQWFGFVKPSYKKYVEPQRAISGESPYTMFVVLYGVLTNHRHHYPPWD